MSFTESLLNSDPSAFAAATQSPFLEAAGQGSVSTRKLSQWLSQDRLYAQAYIGFIGSLIAKVELPHDFIQDQTRSLEWRIVNMLSGALENIHRELKFFAETAEKYGLDLECPAEDSDVFKANLATKNYMSLFRSFEDPQKPLLQGMLVLWATEQCYLSAWTWAKNQRSPNSGKQDADGNALREAFIPNWTSTEFEVFVADIARLTDELAIGVTSTTNMDYRQTWRRVLDIEEMFWPAL